MTLFGRAYDDCCADATHVHSRSITQLCSQASADSSTVKPAAARPPARMRRAHKHARNMTREHKLYVYTPWQTGRLVHVPAPVLLHVAVVVPGVPAAGPYPRTVLHCICAYTY